MDNHHWITENSVVGIFVIADSVRIATFFELASFVSR